MTLPVALTVFVCRAGCVPHPAQHAKQTSHRRQAAATPALKTTDLVEAVTDNRGRGLR